MSQDWYQDVKDFHEQVVGDKFSTKPHVPTDDEVCLRMELIGEEVNRELFEAMEKDDLVKIADGIADSIVVLLGTAVTYGIDIRPIWDEVHRTNMAKKGGVKRADGKLLKPAGWQPPDIDKYLKEQLGEG